MMAMASLLGLLGLGLEYLDRGGGWMRNSQFRTKYLPGGEKEIRI